MTSNCHLPHVQVRDPLYGEWLDLYLTVLAPLPLPVGGLIGETRT